MSYTRALLTSSVVVGAAWFVLNVHAAGTKTWRIQGDGAFQDGTPENVAVTSLGELTIAPAVEQIAETTEPYLWSLVSADDGTLYAGAGNGGKILKVNPDGSLTTLVDTPEIAIMSLAFGPDEHLYAGTSPDGLIYRIDVKQANPTPETIFRNGEKYVWSLLFDKDGTLYAGTGDNGKLYKLTRDAEVLGKYNSEVLFDSEEPHLLSLAMGNGALYVGSDGNGYLYKIDPAVSGKAFVLFDSDEREVKNLVVDPDGTIFVSTATGQIPRPQAQGIPMPQGQEQPVESYLYAVSPNGVVDRVWKSDDGMILSIARYEDKVLVGTGDEGQLYVIDVDGNSSSIGKVTEAQVLRIAPRLGGFALATGNSGKLFSLGSEVAEEGTWESKPHDAEIVSRWGAVQWLAALPNDTNISAMTRSGNTEKPDQTWSEYEELADGKVISPEARFIQLKLKLTTLNGAATPSLRHARVAYLQSNLAPEIAGISVQTPSDGPRASRQAQWRANDPNGDLMEFDLFYQAEGETQWHLLEEESTALTHTFDTTSIPDGDYRLKVTANDKAGNPTERVKSTVFVGEPFRIDNTSPDLTDLSAMRDGGNVVLRFTVTDVTSDIASATYSIDADDWVMVFPTDAIFDATTETFEVTIPNVPQGTHSVAVKTQDVAGNHTTARARF
ncbi:MAG: hypothetical protein O3A46_01020 [Candidatus Poribacteria bacterium]|nr:hypothetical protein [Candidatus Poribacteria bacterium]